MALADSVGAVGAVTQILQEHLLARMFEVSVGKPEDAAENNTNAKLNLFLYEISFDPHLRNLSLRDGEPPPLWLVLKYLLTAFDADENSDTAAAHTLLGRGLSALHELSFLTLVAPLAGALKDNPEPLKLTFDESGVELLSKIMQGTDERYRLSVTFQVRPVMIVPPRAPRSSLLVGIDYTTAPETIVGEDSIQIDVQPSLGPSLDRVDPQSFEAGAPITLFGNDLNIADLEAVLGDVVLTINERHPDRLVVTAEGDLGPNPQGPIAAGTALSAGEIPLIVRRRLSSNRTRSSNLLAARLLPTLSTAAIVAGELVLTGFLLGDAADDVMVSFYRETDGATVHSFDDVVASPDQQTLTVPGAAAVPPAGSYRVILRVNNQQARSSPSVTVP